ncbi:MAG TPA: short-chain dehydrogenase, partial [Thauera sp.]|nr:short-chain dehydrogenase [Thauera sp.]
SEASSHVSGQVFEAQGGRVSVCDGWRTGPQKDKGARLTPAEAGAAVEELMKQSVPAQKVWGS